MPYSSERKQRGERAEQRIERIGGVDAGEGDEQAGGSERGWNVIRPYRGDGLLQRTAAQPLATDGKGGAEQEAQDAARRRAEITLVDRIFDQECAGQRDGD